MYFEEIILAEKSIVKHCEKYTKYTIYKYFINN